jgi:hypothetical protein
MILKWDAGFAVNNEICLIFDDRLETVNLSLYFQRNKKECFNIASVRVDDQLC